jgi:hypothetical protein
MQSSILKKEIKKKEMEAVKILDQHYHYFCILSKNQAYIRSIPIISNSVLLLSWKLEENKNKYIQI